MCAGKSSAGVGGDKLVSVSAAIAGRWWLQSIGYFLLVWAAYHGPVLMGEWHILAAVYGVPLLFGIIVAGANGRIRNHILWMAALPFIAPVVLIGTFLATTVYVAYGESTDEGSRAHQTAIMVVDFWKHYLGTSDGVAAIREWETAIQVAVTRAFAFPLIFLMGVGGVAIARGWRRIINSVTRSMKENALTALLIVGLILLLVMVNYLSR